MIDHLQGQTARADHRLRVRHAWSVLCDEHARGRTPVRRAGGACYADDVEVLRRVRGQGPGRELHVTATYAGQMDMYVPMFDEQRSAARAIFGLIDRMVTSAMRRRRTQGSPDQHERCVEPETVTSQTRYKLVLPAQDCELRLLNGTTPEQRFARAKSPPKSNDADIETEDPTDTKPSFCSIHSDHRNLIGSPAGSHGAFLRAVSAADMTKKPFKVFILAGQSNMEGHAKVETFDYIGDDPATAPLLKRMRGADGKATVCDGTWISYFTGHYDGSANGEGIGQAHRWLRCARRQALRRTAGRSGRSSRLASRWMRRSMSRCSSSRRRGAARACTRISAPPSAGPYRTERLPKKLYYGPPGHGVPKDMDVWLAEKKRRARGVFYR